MPPHRIWAARRGRRSVCRTPAGQIDPAEVERLRSGGDRPPGERGWLDLAEALVRWRHRYDIEAADAAAPGSGTDIEVD